MIKKMKVILSGLLLASSLGAVETTLTNISFVQDENGNLNPNIFIPVYYGSDNQFYSAVGYTSGTFSETDTLGGTEDSKTSLVSNQTDVTLNYITYVLPVNIVTFSFGINSRFSKIDNTEFAYQHVKEDIPLSDGSTLNINEYFIVENKTDIEVQSHNLEFQVLVPLGKYLNSRLTANISPYTTIKVDEKSATKSSFGITPQEKTSTTVQNISYGGLLELQTDLDFFANFGIVVGYSDQPLKYDIVGDPGEDLVDTNEVRTTYLAKVIFEKELLGGINPSIGYGIEYLDIKDNVGGGTISTNRTIFTLGVEKRF